ncbi:concanavalin A-like lectin/glucanase domain-containing protein [Thelonectria olida]|uniref:Concanavalin A-like lectin/glucanase domain-containing protein n=1 Tax=Thelonectria olida TaxID=1576542 RepID=A0A9P8W363_9HYPO|nr:concanavalin A-like lectin/glucanase domain-containing protein [Thelonectria olida]
MISSSVFKNLCLFSLFTGAMAWNGPTYPGYKLVWGDSFTSSGVCLPDLAKWNTIDRETNYNYELESYTSSNNNVRFSGSGTLQLLPRRDDSVPQGWTSGRIESKYTVSPAADKITRVESRLRLAGQPGPTRKGLWPAFWLHGDSYRHGTPTPECGEIDVMENVNGQKTIYSVIHCDVDPGGRCNESDGIGNNTTLNDDEYHVWRLEFDRTDSNFKQQSITWWKDGAEYAKVTGSKIVDPKVWATICEAPLYIIFNVAVGGSWPGNPNRNTLEGIETMMEIDYVAHFETC